VRRTRGPRHHPGARRDGVGALDEAASYERLIASGRGFDDLAATLNISDDQGNRKDEGG
jgi:hypothetical protein